MTLLAIAVNKNMPLTTSPYKHLKALEIYALVRKGKISEHEFGDWLVTHLVDAHKEGMAMAQAMRKRKKVTK